MITKLPENRYFGKDTRTNDALEPIKDSLIIEDIIVPNVWGIRHPNFEEHELQAFLVEDMNRSSPRYQMIGVGASFFRFYASSSTLYPIFATNGNILHNKEAEKAGYPNSIIGRKFQYDGTLFEDPDNAFTTISTVNIDNENIECRMFTPLMALTLILTIFRERNNIVGGRFLSAEEERLDKLLTLTAKELSSFALYLLTRAYYDEEPFNHSIKESINLRIDQFRLFRDSVMSGHCDGMRVGNMTFLRALTSNNTYGVDSEGNFFVLYNSRNFALIAEIIENVHPTLFRELNEDAARANPENPGDTFPGFVLSEILEVVQLRDDDVPVNKQVWDILLEIHRSSVELPVIRTIEQQNFPQVLFNSLHSKSALTILNAIRHGTDMTIGATDIENIVNELNGGLLENSPVKSLQALRNGRIRVVLHEPVFPTMLVRRGKTYVEDEPGTVLADMSIHAFDLDFRGTVKSFPDAIAYRDEEGTILAKHTNIGSSGRVCLGNINNAMSDAEVDAREGSRLPFLSDFLQMLRSCNLDSAYHSSREFVFAEPETISLSQWREPILDIPGLSLIDSTIDVLQQMFGNNEEN